MFDFDASKLLIVGVIALIFIPSKDLPRVLRQVGQFVAKARKMASEFQGQFMDAMKEADMADLRLEAQKLAETARVDVGLDSVTDLKTHMTRAIDRPSATSGSIEPTPAMMPLETKPLDANAFGPDMKPVDHPTMDDGGMKDPNAELRRLTGAQSAVGPVASPSHDAPVSPVGHSAL